MKKIRSFIRLSALLLVCGVSSFSQCSTPFSLDTAPIPNNGQPVNDYANVIDDATEQQLNQKLKDFFKRTNPPVALVVATVRTTGERPIFDYSLAVYRGWKIGGSGDDNPGALLFVAVDDRKYFTQVGRDLEDELPDGVAGQLQRQYLVPAFKQGDYSKGISDTIDAYIRTIDAKQSGTATTTATPQTEPTPRPRTGGTGSLLSARTICCLAGLIVLLIIIFSRAGGGGNRNNRNRWGGGGGFGGGGGALPWIIGSILASSGNRSSGGGSSWGGGDFGGSSGGGSDWGGFGGGGDGGGGGAGGDW